MFTDKPIQAEKLAFRVTPAIQRLASASPFFEPWRRSLNMRFETGQMFSQGFRLYDASLSEGLMGRYKHPVVVIVDALSYSTTDFMVAGFQDNRLGPVIGTDVVTGAGGANVWMHSQLRQEMSVAGGND